MVDTVAVMWYFTQSPRGTVQVEAKVFRRRMSELSGTIADEG